VPADVRPESIAKVIRPYLFYFDKHSILLGADPSGHSGRREQHMIRKILFGGALFVAFTAPVMAQDPCAAPAAPAIPGGARATTAQIIAAQNDIKAYATASDNFHACLAAELGRQKDLAKQNNLEFDPNIQTGLETKAAAQRKDVERVAAAWNAAVQAFNRAQLRKQPIQQPAQRSMGGMGTGMGGMSMGAGGY
jgi:hypothetical protein